MQLLRRTLVRSYQSSTVNDEQGTTAQVSDTTKA